MTVAGLDGHWDDDTTDAQQLQWRRDQLSPLSSYQCPVTSTYHWFLRGAWGRRDQWRVYYILFAVFPHTL